MRADSPGRFVENLLQISSLKKATRTQSKEDRACLKFEYVRGFVHLEADYREARVYLQECSQNALTRPVKFHWRAKNFLLTHLHTRSAAGCTLAAKPQGILAEPVGAGV